jgi:hypothetical protein
VSIGGDTGTLALGMRGGGTYVFSATGNTKVAFTGTAHSDATRQRALVVHYRVGAGAYTVAKSAQVPNVINTPTRVNVVFTLPEGVTECFIRAYLGNTAGQMRWDGFRLSERGPGTVADDAVFFDGDTADTPNYVYAWEGPQDASPSTRTAVVERRPELFTWLPGVSAWDFLTPLTAAAGLRLFCDETRGWELIDPATYKVPGRASIAGWNATRGLDRITRDDPNVFCTAVVVRYRWEDSDGQLRTAYDSAGVPGRVLVWEFDRAYPGPGAAAAILARRQGQGRVQEVTAVSDYTLTPGSEVAITLPGTIEQLGRVTRVSWSLTGGLMDVSTGGLLDLLPGSIAALAGTIDALPGTIDAL